MEINNSIDLTAAIAQLEIKSKIQKQELVQHFHETYESLKPMNIIKKQFSNLTGSSDVGGNVVKTALGLGVGLLTKKLFVGGSTSIVKKLLGTAVELGVAKVVANNSEKIQSTGASLLGKLFGAHKKVY